MSDLIGAEPTATAASTATEASAPSGSRGRICVVVNPTKVDDLDALVDRLAERCVQLDLPAIGHEPRDGVDERRLACPVRPDQPHELTLPDLEVDLIERPQAAEVDGGSVRREDDGAWLASLRRLRGHTHGRDGRVG